MTFTEVAAEFGFALMGAIVFLTVAVGGFSIVNQIRLRWWRR